MSEVDARFIERGIWTNLDQGIVLGTTITTDSTTGTIIIAIMAILSTMGTSHLWSILLFISHQIRATGLPSDGLFRQQQALLRTSLSPSSLMAESTRLWWYWRKRNQKVLMRSLIQFSLATFCTIGFITVSIASSFVVNSSDLEVLVRSPLCGLVNYNSTPADVARNYTDAVGIFSKPYARECYWDKTIFPARCKTFINPRISFTTERAACPFDARFCLASASGVDSVIALDSGLVDLNAAFGLNLPKRDRVKYRRRTTCAVLPLEGRTTVVDAQDFPNALQTGPVMPGEQLLLLHYGERPRLGEWSNTTSYLSILRTIYTSTFSTLGMKYSPVLERNGVGNDFVPFEGMRRNDSDIVFRFVKSSVHFARPVDDLLFSAHRTIREFDVGQGENVTRYLADNPLAGLGCSVQHQFCIKTVSGEYCSKLDSLPLDIHQEDWQEASPVQLSALQLVAFANQFMDLSIADTLNAQNIVDSTGVLRGRTPADLWINELQKWEAAVWASSQLAIADYAIGPSIRYRGIAEYVIKPDKTGDKKLCGSMKMRKAGGFVNINVFGMAFVIGMALFFTMVDIVVLRFFVYHSKFRQALSPRIERWIQDDVLQLQRRAYEAHKEGTWSKLSSEVPLTKANELLAELPLDSVPSANSPLVSAPPYKFQSKASTAF